MTTLLETPIMQDTSEYSTEQSSHVNALISINAAALVDPKNGVKGGADLKSSVGLGTTPWDYVNLTVIRNKVKGSAKEFTLRSGDTLRIRETSASLNSEYFALICKFEHKSGDSVLHVPGTNKAGVGLDLRKYHTVLRPNEDRTKLEDPTSASITDYHWASVGKLMKDENCQGVYNIHFGVYAIDDSDSQAKIVKKGFYYWTATVNVKKLKV